MDLKELLKLPSTKRKEEEEKAKRVLEEAEKRLAEEMAERVTNYNN